MMAGAPSPCRAVWHEVVNKTAKTPGRSDLTSGAWSSAAGWSFKIADVRVVESVFDGDAVCADRLPIVKSLVNSRGFAPRIYATLVVFAWSERLALCPGCLTHGDCPCAPSWW